MAPFRWPEARHELALAKEVAQHNPEKPDEWEAVARRLGKAFSTDSCTVELKGRGCHEKNGSDFNQIQRRRHERFKEVSLLWVGLFILTTEQNVQPFVFISHNYKCTLSPYVCFSYCFPFQ